MGRAPRVEFRGATYHVFARGNRRAKIFLDAEDYQTYAEDLRRLAAREGVAVLAFCLMPNHPHLCVQTHDTPLSAFMHRLNTRHAQRFNRKYGTTGHLHEGRYRAILVDAERYLIRLVRYIHQNPVRANLASDVEVWPYSSYGMYGLARTWIARDEVLSSLGGLANFEAFMRSTPEEDEREVFASARRGFRLVGSPEFAESVHARLRLVGADLGRWQPLTRHEVIAPVELEATRRLEVFGAGVELADLPTASRCEPLRSVRRKLAVYLVSRHYTQAQVGRVLSRDSGAVSRLLAREHSKTNDRDDRSGTVPFAGI